MAMTITLMLFALLIGFAQQNCDVKTISLNKEFELKIGQNALIKGEGLVIGFNSVDEDSRCPEGVDCIWAGNAKITVKATKSDSETVSAQLNTTTEPKEVDYKQYRITLVKLDPRPKAETITSKGYYIATLLIAKQ